MRILDADGKEVAQGETGTIYVANDMPFGGYTDGNTKAFSDDMMSTGDLGHFDEDGRLFVSGRDDDMVISGGENVFPRELEDALIDHDDITDVVVTGIDDKDWGQALAAYIVTKGGASLEHDDVVAYAKERVARFAVPRKTMFLDELPRNPTGKVMKRELPDVRLTRTSRTRCGRLTAWTSRTTRSRTDVPTRVRSCGRGCRTRTTRTRARTARCCWSDAPGSSCSA